MGHTFGPPAMVIAAIFSVAATFRAVERTACNWFGRASPGVLPRWHCYAAIPLLTLSSARQQASLTALSIRDGQPLSNRLALPHYRITTTAPRDPGCFSRSAAVSRATALCPSIFGRRRSRRPEHLMRRVAVNQYRTIPSYGCVTTRTPAFRQGATPKGEAQSGARPSGGRSTLSRGFSPATLSENCFPGVGHQRCRW